MATIRVPQACVYRVSLKEGHVRLYTYAFYYYKRYCIYYNIALLLLRARNVK